MNSASFFVQSGQPLRGEITVPGDKSISHRAVIFGALAEGESHVEGWLAAGDTEATLRAIQALGVRIDRHDANTLTIHGIGKLQAPDGPLDFVNTGTGARLMAGVLSGQGFAVEMDGSYQLRRRPMKRITEPLRLMGAQIDAEDGDRLPLRFQPATLQGVRYELPVASAQVKSAILLAGLFADGQTQVIEPGPGRDHTERMLQAMGAPLTVEGNTASITRGGPLKAMNFRVPGDFSSAAFPIVAACIVPGSDLTIRGVNLNTTRTGLLDALLAMGADITVTETGLEAGEPAGDLRVRYGALQGIELGGEIVVRMIDEFPVFMVAALAANGRTVVRDAQELRVKETDRLAVMTAELRKLGAQITEIEDGFVLDGPQTLQAAVVDGHDDHRVAMSMTVAALALSGQTEVQDAECAGDSFPGFLETMQTLGADLRRDGA